jgi:hypothetical protein
MGTIHEAAATLVEQIKAPPGAVNTLADSRESVIRVFVDPLYWAHIGELPSVFQGYRVVAQKRDPTVAFH